MNRRFQTVEIGGQEVPTFSLEDSLILSCAHGARNFWSRLSWLADVSGLITANPVDWAQAMRLAQEMKCRRTFLLGLCLANEFMGAPVPEAVLAEAEQDSTVLWLLQAQRRLLAGGSGAATAGTARLLYRLKSQDEWGERLRFLSRRWKQLWKFRSILRPLPELDLAGFLPMRQEVVEHLLDFAGVKTGDVLYDLGCGDGRIVIAAAEKYGIRAVGVDLDPRRISEARANARKHGVQDRVRFLLADAKRVDLSEATVVTLFMGMNGMLRLAPGLRQRLRPGARIVSCGTGIYGWPCDEQAVRKSADGEEFIFYLWRIGDVQGGGVKTEASLQSAAQRSR